MGHICHLLMTLSNIYHLLMTLSNICHLLMTLSKTVRTQTFIDLFMLVLSILNF
jgi:hypothetical protein